ncbi:MAG: CinA family protein [Mycobacterium sp.]|nr:CinA family protein [Mycobacterium sp.]
MVAYATELKARLLAVGDVYRDGAVSAPTARAMARNVRALCGADWGVSLTGVAGPEPQEGQPVGTVFLGVAGPDSDAVTRLALAGDRPAIRQAAVAAALWAVADAVRDGRTGADVHPGGS